MEHYFRIYNESRDSQKVFDLTFMTSQKKKSLAEYMYVSLLQKESISFLAWKQAKQHSITSGVISGEYVTQTDTPRMSSSPGHSTTKRIYYTDNDIPHKPQV
jgi:hypothetical protein